MKTWLPFVLSSIVPGSGQILMKEYLKGILMIFISLFLGFLISIIPFYFLYYGTMIWSVIDLYLIMEKDAGKTKAIRYLIFGIVTAIIIIPLTFYMTAISFYKGGQYVKSEYFDARNTKNEMLEISNRLDKYYINNNKYPTDYLKFVNSKPIWDSWKRDSWQNAYKYSQSDSTNYTLTSSGKDGVFETEDDIIVKSN